MFDKIWIISIILECLIQDLLKVVLTVVQEH